MAKIVPETPNSASAWWKTVLGEYPTGVALITSKDTKTGADVGMVVGTFCAISESPAMVGFMPQSSSRSYATIAANGKFTVSVLGISQEEFCRSFAMNVENRWDLAEWVTNAEGMKRLKDCVSWFDAEIAGEISAGDHMIVTGNVIDFGVGNGDSGFPLIYLKGGYGSFAVPSLEFDTPGFAQQLRLVETSRREIGKLAKQIDAECSLAAVAKESIVVLAAASPKNTDEYAAVVGQSFPFAAPMAPVFAAWSSADRHKMWIENTRHWAGEVDRQLIKEMIERVRERGFSFFLGQTMAERFDEVIENPDAKPSEFTALLRALNDEYRTLSHKENWHEHVTSIQFPVFAADNTTYLELYISGFKGKMTAEVFEVVTSHASRTARELTRIMRGAAPEGYVVRTGSV